MTGSFNPIDDGEWSEQAYIHPAALLFQAIVEHDRATVQRLLKDKEAAVDLHRRDHVGRTALQVAILVKAVEIAEDLIDAGARITARLADGRTPLHLAAQYDLPRLVNKLVERSKKNQLELENPKSDTDLPQPALERPSSEDDWSSHDDEDVVKSFSEGDGDDEQEDESDSEDEDEDEKDDAPKISKEKKENETQGQQDDVLDDIVDEPDIIDVNIHDWDFGFTAICYAVMYGSLPTLEALLAAGADPKLPSSPSTSTSYTGTPYHPLTLTIIRKDNTSSCEMAESLIKAGATASTADSSVHTIFHSLVRSGRTSLVETVLRCDPNIDKVINLPFLQWRNVVFPVVSAIQYRCYSTLMVLVAHGARLDLQETDVTKARDIASVVILSRSFLGELMNLI
jgi:ankyrin repeat protein